jgi:hypothetical protein
MLGMVEDLVEAGEVGELSLKGFSKPVSAFNIASLKAGAAQV